MNLFSCSLGVITSGSMEPALREDDIVIVKNTGDYGTGDIVVYQSGGGLIAHRIIEENGDKVTTKGDANNVADDPINRDDIKGVVAGRILNLPLGIAQRLQAKYVSSASGSSSAEVARWDVSVDDETVGVLHVMSGSPDYGSEGYGFTVDSNSETTAQYHISIALSSGIEGAQLGDMSMALLKYDDGLEDWSIVAEGSGELVYDDILPIGHNENKFMMKVMAGEGTAGIYQADIRIDAVQVD